MNDKKLISYKMKRWLSFDRIDFVWVEAHSITEAEDKALDDPNVDGVECVQIGRD